MVDNNRRKVIQIGGIVAGSIVGSGIGMAKSESNTGLALRGDASDPISKPELFSKRDKEIDKVSESGFMNNRVVSNPKIPKEEMIVAYNLDLVGEGIEEYFGTVSSKTANKTLSESNNPEDRVERIHKRANDKKKESIVKKTQVGKVQNSTRNQATVSSNEYDFDDFSSIHHYNYDTEDSRGNVTNYEVIYRNHSEPSVPICAMDVQVEPEIGGDKQDRIRIRHDWNSDHAELESYGPGNTEGTSSSGWSLGFTSDGIVNVGRTWTRTKPDLDVNNESKKSMDLARHNFDLSGDLKSNTVRVNNASVAEFDSVDSPDGVAVTVDWIVVYEGTTHTYETEFLTNGGGGGGGGCNPRPCPTTKE